MIELLKKQDLYLNQFDCYLADVRKRALYKYPNKLKEFSTERGISEEILHQYKVFYVGDGAELLHPNYLNWVEIFGLIDPTNHKPIFNDRLVYPIFTAEKKPMAFVGYKKESNNRYLYGSTAIFYERDHDFYGLDAYYKALEHKLLIVVEGITDKLSLESLGLLDEMQIGVVANCGTGLAKAKINQLNRKDLMVIAVPDRDQAGKKWETIIKKNIKRWTILRPPFTKANDLAEFVQKEGYAVAREELKVYLENIKHRALLGENAIELTMI